MAKFWSTHEISASFSLSTFGLLGTPRITA